MPVSDEFLSFVSEQFSELGSIRTRRMFGGVGVYFGDKFFALLDNDTLYLKVDGENEPAFRQANMKPFEPWPGHVMAYWTVPGEVLEDKAALAKWSQGALKAAGKAGKKRASNTRGKRDKPAPKTK